MDIEVYTYFENVPFHEAVVRYRFNPDEVASRKESDKLNLIRADYIDSDDEGARDIGIPTCARNFLAEPATDLDREVYQAMVDEGMLQADVTGVDISLYDYSNNVPSLTLSVVSCGVTESSREPSIRLSRAIRLRCRCSFGRPSSRKPAMRYVASMRLWLPVSE